MNKICTKCNIEKPIGEFYQNTRYRDGYNGWCKGCISRITTDRYREKASGVTREQYESMFTKQGGACALCGEHQETLKKELNVDHNHETGEVRALLCARCNMGLGCFGDNSSRLREAAEYLESYSILSEHADHEEGIIEENEPLTSGE
jgi:hypothetical protein